MALIVLAIRFFSLELAFNKHLKTNVTDMTSLVLLLLVGTITIWKHPVNLDPQYSRQLQLLLFQL